MEVYAPRRTILACHTAKLHCNSWTREGHKWIAFGRPRAITANRLLHHMQSGFGRVQVSWFNFIRVVKFYFFYVINVMLFEQWLLVPSNKHPKHFPGQRFHPFSRYTFGILWCFLSSEQWRCVGAQLWFIKNRGQSWKLLMMCHQSFTIPRWDKPNDLDVTAQLNLFSWSFFNVMFNQKWWSYRHLTCSLSQNHQS